MYVCVRNKLWHHYLTATRMYRARRSSTSWCRFVRSLSGRRRSRAGGWLVDGDVTRVTWHNGCALVSCWVFTVVVVVVANVCRRCRRRRIWRRSGVLCRQRRARHPNSGGRPSLRQPARRNDGAPKIPIFSQNSAYSSPLNPPSNPPPPNFFHARRYRKFHRKISRRVELISF